MKIDRDEILKQIKPFIMNWMGYFVRKSGDTMTGDLILDSTTSPVSYRYLAFRTNGGIYRWNLGPGNSVETGSGNGGSDFDIYRYADNGAYLGHVLRISRSTGNFGVVTTNPTAQFSVSEKVGMSADGGVMVKLTNKTGANSVKGEVVHANSAQNNSVVKIVVDVPDPIGVFYESGVADGAEAWVVVSGIADVYFVGDTTRGHMARGFITGDAGYVTGQALSEAVPGAPFATNKHFYEIGHVLESRTGAGLAKCVLHFN
jgi:hypothetical protein